MSARPDDVIVEADDIERIERRMEVRRATIRGHVAGARREAGEAIRAWPVAVLGIAAAAGFLAAAPRRKRRVPAARASFVGQAADRAANATPLTERFVGVVGLAAAIARAWPQFRYVAADLARRRR
jgi:hypothetical protein